LNLEAGGAAWASPTPGYDARRGAVAEWLGRGLQSLVHQFDSGRRLFDDRESARVPAFFKAILSRGDVL
jgi:hypothetical protein